VEDHVTLVISLASAPPANILTHLSEMENVSPAQKNARHAEVANIALPVTMEKF
jgi:hypothetical protein